MVMVSDLSGTRRRAATSAALAASALLCMNGLTLAQSPGDFYKGRQIQVIIATNPGVGYDIYARMLAAHMGKHIPGNPSFVPRNMIGAGGLRAAEYVWRVAPKDGLTIGSIGRGLPFEPMLGQNELGIDPVKFTWLGSMNRETAVAFSWNTSKVRTFADLRVNELLTPGTGAGADSRNHADGVQQSGWDEIQAHQGLQRHLGRCTRGRAR